jgi:protein TonB
MFEPIYEKSKWYRRVSGGTIASLAIHVAGYTALVLGGADPAALADQVTEGIVFLAPPPSAPAGPTTVAQALRYVELPSTVAAMAAVSDLHVSVAIPSDTLRSDETTVAAPTEASATVFERPADSVYFAEQVDSPAAYDDRSAAPAYPDSLQRAGVEGSVMAQFIVDTTGRVEMETVRLLESTNLRFTESVLAALPRMLFRPAVRNGAKARQVVEVPFRFRVVPRDTLRAVDPPRIPPP